MSGLGPASEQWQSTRVSNQELGWEDWMMGDGGGEE
jgi:hypothetical protein